MLEPLLSFETVLGRLKGLEAYRITRPIGPGRPKRLEAFRITRPIGLLKLWKNASVSVGVSVEVVLLRVGVNNTGSLSV